MAEVVEVEVKSDWASKINWVQMASVAASILIVFGVNVPPELQAQIAAAITALSAVVTIVMRTWFTTKLTESSAAKV